MIFHTYIADTPVIVEYSEEKNNKGEADKIIIEVISTEDGRPLTTTRTPELESQIIAQIRVAKYEAQTPNGETNVQAN